MQSQLVFLITFLCGVFLALHGIFRFRFFLKSKEIISYHFSMATFLIGLGLAVFGLASYLAPAGNISFVLNHVAFITAGLEALGYVHFIVIPAYILFDKKEYIRIKYLLVWFVLLITTAAVFYRPYPDDSPFSMLMPQVAIGFIFLLELAFIFNTVLILRNFKKLQKLSLFNTVALVVVYLFATSSGAYMYIGNDQLLLNIASGGLLSGIMLLFLSAVLQTKESRLSKQQ